MTLRLNELREIVRGQGYDVHELVDLLELTTEDIIRQCSHKLREHKEKFGVQDEEDDNG